MSQAMEKYLDRVMIYAHRSENEAPLIREELRDHLLKKVADLEAEGLPREDAIFQAIESHGHPRRVGYGLRRRWPLLDVRSQGTARGIIAIGPRAVGVFAFGGAAFGVVAFGGFSAGLLSTGGFALGLLFSLGGFSLSPLGLAYGGFAMGMLAIGGFAVGVAACGGMAAGLWAYGATAFSHLDPQTMPQLFLSPAKFLLGNDHSGNWIFHAVWWPVFFLLVIVTNILQLKESSRIRRADPTLVE